MAGVAALLGFLWLRNRTAPSAPSPPPRAQPSAPAGAFTGKALVRLPADDAPHTAFMEWWYYNCHLRAEDGREFSCHYVYFLVNSVIPSTIAQVSLVDHQSGRRYSHQRQSPGNPSAGTTGSFRFALGDWSMAGADGQDTLKLQAPDLAFDLRLRNSGPTVFQGGTGLLDFGEAGSSYYYSRPRMGLEGTLTLAGHRVPVRGQGWFDHQWGDFQPLRMGWDWFSLQLEDGADVMLYRVYDRQRRLILASGTYTRNGATEVLGERDFSAQPLGTWRSPGTGTEYTTAWKLAIPRHGLAVELRPVVPDCEFDARNTSLLLYWEGAVQLSGSHRGRGFQEICPPRPEIRK